MLGLGLVVFFSKFFELPPGAAGGILAGSQTMSAAIGTAEMAVTQGAYKLPAGTTAESVSGMIALGYGVTYIYGTVGIILISAAFSFLNAWGSCFEMVIGLALMSSSPLRPVTQDDRRPPIDVAE